MDILSELEKDFKDELSRINFSAYDPYSRPFMNALFIGQMYECIKNIGGDDVEEELEGARKYFDAFQSTGDGAFRDMASDELRHAGILIKKHLAKSTTDEEKERLNKHEKERQEMLKLVSVKGE